MEHSTGITEEPIPDLTTMTLGSELSITEAFNKTELSDSGDSLKSFEKHEMSTMDSLTDESWAGKHSGKLFLAHLSHRLRVSYCHWPMSVVCRASSVVCRQQLL